MFQTFHVTQRGNRRERVFFSHADYELYRDLLGEARAVFFSDADYELYRDLLREACTVFRDAEFDAGFTVTLAWSGPRS